MTVPVRRSFESTRPPAGGDALKRHPNVGRGRPPSLAAASATLEALAQAFGAVAETLDTGDMFAAGWNLDLVAQDIRAIGLGLAEEGLHLAELITLNLTWSRRIANAVDDVRLLAAMVSNVKVELASVSSQGDQLESFGRTLEQLASNANRMLRNYQATHEELLSQLRKTVALQSHFELEHRGKLDATAAEIDNSVLVFRARHKAVAATICDVEQRLRAAASLIRQASGALEALAPRNGDDDHSDHDAPARDRLRSDLLRIAASLDEIQRLGLSLTASRDGASFLGDLEPKLRGAEHLIQQCRQSRIHIDGVSTSIIARFEALGQLAAEVSAMVADMTIVGTNAIVKSSRLGQDGAALSIIAQHLRSHALKVTESIKALNPAMAAAQTAATTFIGIAAAQGAARMTAIAERAADILGSFDRVGAQTIRARADLEVGTSGIAEALKGIAENLEASSI